MGIDIETNKMKSEGPVGLKPRGFIESVALSTILKYTDNYSEDKVKGIFMQVDEYSKIRLADIVQPLIGAEKLLKSLIDNGVLVSLATTDITSRAELAMKVLSFENYFVDIVGADMVEKAKPSPDLLEFIAAKHDLSPEDILVIGDSIADLKMAQNYMCNFVGVKTGLITDEFITESKYIIENLEGVKVEK